MKIPWPRRRRDVSALGMTTHMDEELDRARKDLQHTKAQTPVHRALISAAAREVFEVNHLAETFKATLRRVRP